MVMYWCSSEIATTSIVKIKNKVNIENNYAEEEKEVGKEKKKFQQMMGSPLPVLGAQVPPPSPPFIYTTE